jgi:DivIVA domain-containing protein
VALDRSSIQRTDFPQARRGYEPTAVDAHLREIADEVEGVTRAAAQPVAAAASAQVQRIIEVAETAAEQLRAEAQDETQQLRAKAGEDAERTRAQAADEAEQLRADAGKEAREHVRRVSGAARELLERIGTLQEELGSFLGRLHDDAGRLSAELRSLERDVADLGSAEAEEPGAPSEPLQEEAVEEPDLEVELAEPTDTTRVDDEEAARLVALDMALGGSPREETERYLSEHYQLSNAHKLLDDVYELAGS